MHEAPILPGPDATDATEHVKGAAEVRVEVALHAALIDTNAPRTPPPGAFWQVQGWLEAGHACAMDGVALGHDAILQRAALGDRDLRPRSHEAQVLDFRAAYAATTRQAAARDTPTPPLHEALAPEALESQAARTCGPAARLRKTKGYQGRIQPSRVLGRPAAGETHLRAELTRLAAWAEAGATRDARDPVLTAAVVYGRLLQLHPFRQGNHRMALLAADRVLRRVPGGEAARLALATTLRAREEACADALRAALRGQGWGPWLRTFLEALSAAADVTWARWCAYVRAYQLVRARLEDHEGRELIGRTRTRSDRLADLLARRPFLGVPQVVQAGLAQRRTAGRYLRTLVRLGVAVPEPRGRHDLYRVPAFTEALGIRPPRRGRRGGLDRLAAVARTTLTFDPADP